MRQVNSASGGGDQDAYRHQLRDSAKIFKSNWIQFGELLTKVASDGLYQEWGYKTFEEYCRLEVRIKKNTAIKLTSAYFFITQGDPDILSRSGAEGVPELDVIGVLQRAKNDENCPEDVYQRLRDSVMEKPLSTSTLTRRLKELTKPEEETASQRYHEQSIKLITRLRQRIRLLDSVPERFGEYLSEMEEYLESL